MRSALLIGAVAIASGYVVVPKSGDAYATCAALGFVPANVTPAGTGAIADAIKAVPAAGNTAEIGSWTGKVFNTPCLSATAYVGNNSLSLSLSCAPYVVCSQPATYGYMTATTTTSTSTVDQTDVTTDRTATTTITTLSQPTTTTTTSTSTSMTTTFTPAQPIPTPAYPPLPPGSGWNVQGTYAFVKSSAYSDTASDVCNTYGLRLGVVNDLSQLQLSYLGGFTAFIAPQSPNGTVIAKAFARGSGGWYQIKDFYNQESITSTIALCGKVVGSSWQYTRYTDPSIMDTASALAYCRAHNNSGLAVFQGTGDYFQIANGNGTGFARAATPFYYSCDFVNTYYGYVFLDYIVTGGDGCPSPADGAICMH